METLAMLVRHLFKGVKGDVMKNIDDLFESIINESIESAISESQSISFAEISLPSSLNNLGKKIAYIYSTFNEHHGNIEIVRYTAMLNWILIKSNQLIAAKAYELGLVDSELFNFPIYGAEHFSEFISEELSEISSKYKLPEYLISSSLLWFSEADLMIVNGDAASASDKIADAFGAFHLFKLTFEVAQTASCAGKSLAEIRHKKGAKDKELVAKYWRESISRELSASKAAEKILMAGATPFSHKITAEIISTEKKKKPK